MQPASDTVTALEALRPRFAGQTAIVLATGPSLPEIWQDRATSRPVITVNDAAYLAPNADIVYACDMRWWQHHWPKVGDHPGLKLGIVALDGLRVPGVLAIRHSGVRGYEPRLGLIRHGHGSGYQAVHLAAQLGASQIILVGFDMREPKHFFGDHPKGVATLMPVGLWIETFQDLAPELKRLGVEVLNATPHSGLPQSLFPFIGLDDVL